MPSQHLSSTAVTPIAQWMAAFCHQPLQAPHVGSKVRRTSGRNAVQATTSAQCRSSRPTLIRHQLTNCLLIFMRTDYKVPKTLLGKDIRHLNIKESNLMKKLMHRPNQKEKMEKSGPEIKFTGISQRLSNGNVLYQVSFQMD